MDLGVRKSRKVSVKQPRFKFIKKKINKVELHLLVERYWALKLRRRRPGSSEKEKLELVEILQSERSNGIRTAQ